MTVTAMQAVKQHIVDSGLDSGYSIVFDSLNDARDKGRKTILIKNAGPGLQRIIADQIDITIHLIDFEQNVLSATQRISDINRLFIRPGVQPGVSFFQPLGNPEGSFSMDDNRKMWRFDLRVFQSWS